MKSRSLDTFSTHLKNSLIASQTIAISCQQPEILPEHLLYGFTLQKGCIAMDLLNKHGLRAEPLKAYLLGQRGGDAIEAADSTIELEFAFPTRDLLVKAALLAQQYGHTYIGTEHALTELLQLNNDPSLQKVWKHFSLPVDHIHTQLIQVLKNTAKYPDLSEMLDGQDAKSVERSKTPALEYFCTHLTDSKVQENIDPVIGRESEIERLIHILSRRTKNNPVLIGDPGVGKTAIVEGLAKRILEQKVPEILLNKRIYSLDLGLMIAGTMYRGEFEGRIKQIVEEIRKDPNIILFIDELHTLMGTGGANGTLDAANLLKPALAKGDIRCIGATTLDEYRKHIEPDAALERRFQAIIVDEPSPEETLAILKGVRPHYERFHRVTIVDEALTTAVALSQRYLSDRFFPDKAIDLIDESASKMKTLRKPNGFTQSIQKKYKELEKLEKEKLALAQQEQFGAALRLKTQEMDTRQAIRDLQAKQRAAAQEPEGTVSAREIAEVVSRQTLIPVQELLREEQAQLLDLEKLLRKKIVGQDDAIATLAQFIRRSRAGLSSPQRPIGSFMFLGPSGVGKTELANVLASEIYHDPKSLIRIDMSEFNESFQAAKLIGAPAGYVGYKDGNSLMDQVRRRPYSVILFDEIEKAHPDIFNILLQILEDGRLTDATGSTVNFKHALIILTSNIGIEELNRVAALGFADAPDEGHRAEKEFEVVQERLLASLRESFRPEFLNRLDKIIVFRPLQRQALRKIVELQLQELQQRLTDHQMTLLPSPSVINYIAEKGSIPEEGARAIRRVIQEEIENPLAERLLSGGLRGSNTVKLVKGAKTILFQ